MSANEAKKENINIPVNEVHAIDDNELVGVSGGLWNITLLDTCQKRFDYLHCCKNFGKCPNLVINSEKVHKINPFKKAYSGVFSCSKGYYSQVSWADNAEDED